VLLVGNRAVGVKQLPCCYVPGKFLSLFVASALHTLAQSLIAENAVHGTHNFKDIFGIH